LVIWSGRTYDWHRSLHRLRHRHRLRQDPVAAITSRPQSRVLLQRVTPRKRNVALRRQHPARFDAKKKNGAGVCRPASGSWSVRHVRFLDTVHFEEDEAKAAYGGEDCLYLASRQQELMACAVLKSAPSTDR